MYLVLYIDGIKWVEIPVRNKSNIPWQSAQVKRDFEKDIQQGSSWQLFIQAESKLSTKSCRRMVAAVER